MTAVPYKYSVVHNALFSDIDLRLQNAEVQMHTKCRLQLDCYANSEIKCKNKVHLSTPDF